MDVYEYSGARCTSKECSQYINLHTSPLRVAWPRDEISIIAGTFEANRILGWCSLDIKDQVSIDMESIFNQLRDILIAET